MWSLVIAFSFFILLHIQSCLAFQAHHHNIIENYTMKRNSNNDVFSLKAQINFEESEEGVDLLQSQRRNFLRSSLSFLMSSSALMSSSKNAAAVSTSGYIPDMKGGFKKPKGVGGLTKKIRRVGDIMVSKLHLLWCHLVVTSGIVLVVVLTHFFSVFVLFDLFSRMNSNVIWCKKGGI